MPYNHRLENNPWLNRQQKEIIKRQEEENERLKKNSERKLGEMESLGEWIENNIRPIKSFNPKHTSYSLKCIAENDLNQYITNDNFKNAMIKAGYNAKDKTTVNWIFNISQKSLALK